MNKSDTKKLLKISDKLDKLTKELDIFNMKQQEYYDNLSEKKQNSDVGYTLGNIIDYIEDASDELKEAYHNIDLSLDESLKP